MQILASLRLLLMRLITYWLKRRMLNGPCWFWSRPVIPLIANFTSFIACDIYSFPRQTNSTAVTPNQQAPASGESERLAQLKLPRHLRDSGLLTNDEFEVEKRKIMQGY